MNKIYNIKTLLLAMFTMIAVTSCDDSDNWAAGPQPAPNNPGVYFDGKNPAVIEVEANSQGVLTKDYFTIKLGRDELKSSSALQVPITIHHADPNLTISKTVDFEAGSSTALLKITIGEFEFSTQYNLSIEIDANFANPYKSYEDMANGGSTRLDSKIEVVSVLATATFTMADNSGSRKPEFYPFEHNIYDNQDGTYSIKNFLFNNAGYDFDFTIDEDNSIRPLEDCGYHSTGDDRWYFYSENSSSSSYRIPCYIPGENPEDYITYIYFYTADNSSSYTDFWLDLSTKTGRMMGYSRYSESSSGRIAFNISWI